MNIDRNHLGGLVEEASSLSRLYEPVQHWRELLAAV
jgi:hypothetical protein